MTEQTATAVREAGSRRFRFYAENFTVFFCGLIGGLALSRILFEGLFPRWLGLGRPYGAFPFALLVAFLLWSLWRVRQTQRPGEPTQAPSLNHPQSTISDSTPYASTHRPPAPLTSSPPHPLTYSPLLLNLLWLGDPAVDLIRSQLIFAASVWLTAVLLTWEITSRKSWRWLGILYLVAALLPVYGLTMSTAVGAADTFEFQVVTPQLGIVHPTGYPLYLLLGKLFTLLPLGSLAWRLNFGSVVFALAALSLLYLLLLRLTAQPLPALLGAVVTGVTGTFWSQAIIAEVYALHALIVMAALLLMAVIGDWRLAPAAKSRRPAAITPQTAQHLAILLSLTIGLGMTNHVTTIFLIPPAILTLIFAYRQGRKNQDDAFCEPFTTLPFYLKILAAFSLPLLLYAYLPLRWQAVNEEAMGLSRFVDWVVAGRFQGALQLRAWLNDSTRYAIIGRLYLDNWGWFNLTLAGIGVLFMLWRRWQTAVILLLTWLSYTFYTLNYYVPDLAVFLIPAQLIVGLFWAGGFTFLREGVAQIGRRQPWPDLSPLLATLVLIPTLLLAAAHWSATDQSAGLALEEWGRRVLELPLAAAGAILADGEKIAPLHYLQVAERRRPDLDISVWPDEAAYRAQVDERVAAGQTVYLARFLPGLPGAYHLRSAGPLVEVSASPLGELPAAAVRNELSFGPITLLGHTIAPLSTAADSTAVTLYWQAAEPVSSVQHIYLRWAGQAPGAGRHPVHNFYPTNAWQPAEIVPDYHELPHPIRQSPEAVALQVALAPPFTPPDQLEWQTVTEVELPAAGLSTQPQNQRIQIGPAVIQTAVLPGQIRPQASLAPLVSGQGAPAGFEFTLIPAEQALTPAPLPLVSARAPVPAQPYTLAADVDTDLANGRYQLVVTSAAEPIICGWLQPVTSRCTLGPVAISGLPLPADATNYDDKIALLDYAIENESLQPGGQLAVALNWQSLAPLTQDYTVFVQVVDANDRLVGQVDSWPVQGTFPTSQWTPGEQVTDPYTIQLSPDLPAGDYRLLLGWYLLGSGQRLPLLDRNGVIVEDKLVIPGLMVE